MLSCCKNEEKKEKKNNELDLSSKEQQKNLNEYFNNNQYENDNPDNIDKKLTLLMDKLEKDKDNEPKIGVKDLKNAVKAAKTVGFKKSEGIKWYHTGWGRLLIYVSTGLTVATLSTTAIGLVGEFVNFAWPELFIETFIGTTLTSSFLDRIREWFFSFSTNKDNNNVNLQNNDNKKEGQEEKHELDVNRLVCNTPHKFTILADKKAVKKQKKLEKNFKDLNSKYKTLISKYEQQNVEFQKMQKTNEELFVVNNNGLLNSKKTENQQREEEYSKKMQELEEQKKKLIEENENIKNELEIKKNALNQLQLYKNQLEDVNKNELLTKLEEKYIQMQNDYELLLKKKEELSLEFNNKKEQLKKMNSDLVSLDMKNKNKEEEVKKLEDKNKQLENDFGEKQSQIVSLNNDIQKKNDEYKTLIKEAQKVQNYHEKLMNEDEQVNLQLDHKKKELIKANNDYLLLNDKQLSLKNNIKLLNNEKESLNKDKERLENIFLKEQQEYEQFVKNAKIKQEEMQNNISKLNEEEKEKENNLKIQRNELDELTQKMSSLTKNNISLEKQKKSLDDDIKGLTKEKELLNNQIYLAKKDKKNIIIEYNKKSSKYNELVDFINEEEKRSKVITKEYEDMKKKYNELKTAIDKKKVEMLSIENKIRNNENQLNQLNKKLTKINGESFCIKSNTKSSTAQNVEKEPSYDEKQMKLLYSKITNGMFDNPTTQTVIINGTQNYNDDLKCLIPNQESIDSIVIHTNYMFEVIRKNGSLECYLPDHDNKTMMYFKPCINKHTARKEPYIKEEMSGHNYAAMFKEDGALTIRFVFLDDELNSLEGIQNFLESLHLDISDCVNMNMEPNCFPGKYANNLCVKECFLRKKNNNNVDFNEGIYSMIQNKYNKEDIESLLDDKAKALYKKLFYNLKLFFDSYKKIILNGDEQQQMYFLDNINFNLMLCKHVIRLLEEGGYLSFDINKNKVSLSSKITDKEKNRDEDFLWIGLVTIQRQLDDIPQYSTNENSKLKKNNDDNNEKIKSIKNTVNDSYKQAINTRFEGTFIQKYNENLSTMRKNAKSSSYSSIYNYYNYNDYNNYNNRKTQNQDMEIIYSNTNKNGLNFSSSSSKN